MDYEHLKNRLIEFRDERDWKQFHTPENLAKSISIEAGELLECYQWNDDADMDSVKEELADVFIYCVLMSDRLGVDLLDIAEMKITKNAKKYPVNKAKGNAIKYNKL